MAASSEQPVVVVIAGPNGAGKSTCAQGVLGERTHLFEFVNADTIAAGLSALRPDSVAVRAGRLMLERIHELCRQRMDFAFETTLSGRSHARLLSEMKHAGYLTTLLYISLPTPELCVRRVAWRVQQGGHDIPDSVIRRRFRRSVNNLFQLYMPLVDDWSMYDNSQSVPTLIACRGNDGQASVLDQAKYDDLKRYI